MSIPKTILTAFYTRLNTALGSTHTIIRGKRNFSEQELPAIAIFRERWERTSEQGKRASMSDALIIIEAHADYGGSQPQDVAEDLIATLRTAIETADATLSGAVRTGPGIMLEAHQVDYPENPDNTVGVRLEYSAPHVEAYGNP